MGRSLSPRQRQFLGLALGGTFPLLSFLELVESGTVPWVAITVIGVATAVPVGPLVWFMRDRVSTQRREHLTLVAGGIAMVLVPIAIGLALGFGVPSFIPPFEALIVAGCAGCLMALVAEQTIVPERLRAV